MVSALRSDGGSSGSIPVRSNFFFPGGKGLRTSRRSSSVPGSERWLKASVSVRSAGSPGSSPGPGKKFFSVAVVKNRKCIFKNASGAVRGLVMW